MSGGAQGPALIWCPFGSTDEARSVAAQLLDESLVACANILPPMFSLFEWHGERGESQEIGVIFKTDRALLDQAIERIACLHSYDSPAIMGWRVDASTAGVNAWLGSLTEKRSGK